MPLFISDSELQTLGTNVSLITERADAHIRNLLQQLEAQKARADAAAITAEQQGAVVEQKFLAMSSQFKLVESEKNQLAHTLERRSTELAHGQAQVHKLELELMKQDSDREHIMCELNEVRRAKRELLDVVEQKNAEVTEKNTYIKGCLDKIVFLTDERSTLEGKLREAEAELIRSQAVHGRLSQEKELLGQHNSWLNEELADKVGTLLKERRTSSDLEIELRSKLAKAEQACKEIGESLQRKRDQAKDLELRLNQTREELRSTKEDATVKEDHLSLEVETASKLVDLYKQSSEEWAKKAIDLEGVIKALEVHLSQVERDFEERLQEEVEGRKASEKNAKDVEEKMEKLEKEIDLLKKTKERDSLFLISNMLEEAPKDLNSSHQQLPLELHEDGSSLPIISSEVSGTAFAAALLRDGWSMTKMYVKYQETVDAWRHERQERKQSQAILQRVLHEIEQRAELILDERAEHARMAEAYAVMEEKLHASVEEQSFLEHQIGELKAELRKRERDLNGAKQECSDLQTEVAVLLKECTDIKQRSDGERLQLQGTFEKRLESQTASDVVISEQLVTFKNIHELVEQNSQLRAVVRCLGHQNEERETELKEAFNLELRKRTDEATRKVSMIVRKSEEQMQLIASLQGTVGMYKRLYEEELKSRSMLPNSVGIIAVSRETSGDDLRGLITRSQEDIEVVRKEASQRISVLEDDLNKARQDANTIRMERDRLVVEATYAREQLQTIVKDSEHQRKEMDAVLARNVEFSQIITDYQRRLRENAEHVQSVEEKSRRLSVEVSVLEREKELLSSAEKRASQELSSLSNRVHRLQATLDSHNTIEEAQENMRSAEKKKLEDEVNRMQKEWVEMKQELDSERAHTRHLSNERDQVVKQAMDRIESISKELADALQKLSVAETRAHLAEAQHTELESNLKKAEEKISAISSQRKKFKDLDLELDAEAASQSEQASEEIDRLREELDASKNHVEQYKCLAQVNEDALLQMEAAHNQFKEESEKAKEHFNTELSSLRAKVVDLEKQLSDKENELAATIEQKEHALISAEKDILLLRESDSGKGTLLEHAEERIKALKDELEKEHQQWRTAQGNYERQVLLQADTIRELTIGTNHNAVLEKEVVELRAKAGLSTAELASSRVAWEMEKETFLSQNESLTSKLKELEEQNNILLNRVGVSHSGIGEHGKGSGDASENAGNDLQDVIRYLRRSKETSDMEISLLKQERLRLQKQLESALRAAEDAQADLRHEHENNRLSLCSQEEFRSLQAQVREMTLLRESNAQLRLENRRNFEECQNLREKLQKGQEDEESLKKLLKERELELDAAVKDVDIQKAEISRWENRVSQLLQKFKTVDVEDYHRVQSELASTQETLRLQQADLDASKAEVQNLLEAMQNSKLETSVKDEKMAELEKRIKDSEAFVKTETDKYRKQALFYKRRTENLAKEKDDTRDAYQKQIDEIRASANKRGVGESHRSEAQIRQEVAAQHEMIQKENDNLMKEKETRIQTLERALEREREELRKDRDALRMEKSRRQKERNMYIEACRNRDIEKQKLLDELNALKREKETFSENVQGKKSGRKIVRPKIESPVESQMQLELNEMGNNEAALEALEPDTEARDDAKLASSAVGEVLENVTTTSAIVVASTFSVNPLDDSGLSVRKRPSAQAHSSQEELPLSVGSRNEATPAQKRQKGLESDIVLMAPTIITENLVAVETSKPLEIDGEHADLATSERDEVNLSGTLEANQMVDMLEINQSNPIPAGQTEQSGPRRPRIVRSDIPSPQRDAALMSIETEKNAVTEGELLEERETQDTGVFQGEHMHDDLQGTQLTPSRMEEDMVDLTEPAIRSSEASGAAFSQPPSQDILLATEMEETENVLVALSDVPDVTGPSESLLTSEEPGVSVTAVETTESPLLKPIETVNDAILIDTALDVEDGEIEPDEPNEANAESVSRDLDEDKHARSASLDDDEKDSEPPEVPRDEKLLSNIECPQTSDVSPLEGAEVALKPDGMTGDGARSQVVTRQAGRGATVVLPDRTRERLFAKRTGSLPPSPGRRIPRAAKRSIGVQRGRTITRDGDPGDEEAKKEVPEPASDNSDLVKKE